MENLRSFIDRERVKLYGVAVLVIAALGGVAYQFVEPAPPAKIAIATGQPEGAYAFFGQRYKTLIGEEEVELEVALVESSGSLENLRLLREGEVDLAFVQTGMEEAGRGDGGDWSRWPVSIGSRCGCSTAAGRASSNCTN